MRTDAKVYRHYDVIANAAPGERADLEQHLGMNLNADGMLHDPWIRSLFRPVEHSLRDPMHVLISGGVGNINVLCLVCALRACGISLKLLQDWIGKFTLPHRHGKVDTQWLARKRFGKKWDQFASFAGIMLTLIPLILAFLDEVIEPGHELEPHHQCFRLLSYIVGICFMGPHDAMQHTALLARFIEEYIEAFSSLYPNHAVPKLHQMHHLINEALGVLLSCFVTERKHRTTKRAALFVFRHIDNAVITDMVNRQCDTIQGNVNSLMHRTFLVSPKQHQLNGMDFERSREAVLSCGQLRINDMLYLTNDTIGKAIGFWKFPNQTSICVQVEIHEPSGEENRFDLESSSSTIVDASEVVDAVMWSVSRGTMFIIKPFRVVLPTLG